MAVFISSFVPANLTAQILNEDQELPNSPIFTKKVKYGDVVKFDPETLVVKRLVSDGGI